MASVSVAPSSGLRDRIGNTVALDRLSNEMNDMKIRDDKVSNSHSLFCLNICHWNVSFE